MDVGFRRGCLIGLSQVVGSSMRDSLALERGAHDAESMMSDFGESRRAVWYKTVFDLRRGRCHEHARVKRVVR